jgi:hypothetical protein
MTTIRQHAPLRIFDLDVDGYAGWCACEGHHDKDQFRKAVDAYWVETVGLHPLLDGADVEHGWFLESPHADSDPGFAYERVAEGTPGGAPMTVVWVGDVGRLNP